MCLSAVQHARNALELCADSVQPWNATLHPIRSSCSLSCLLVIPLCQESIKDAGLHPSAGFVYLVDGKQTEDAKRSQYTKGFSLPDLECCRRACCVQSLPIVVCCNSYIVM